MNALIISDRPEQKCLPEPELNRNYIAKYWTKTGTENLRESKPEPKPEPTYAINNWQNFWIDWPAIFSILEKELSHVLKDWW